jgi:hypothetical protein
MHEGPRASLAALRRFRSEDRRQYCATLSIQVFGTMVYLAMDDVAFFTVHELYM